MTLESTEIFACSMSHLPAVDSHRFRGR